MIRGCQSADGMIRAWTSEVLLVHRYISVGGGVLGVDIRSAAGISVLGVGGAGSQVY